MLLYLSSDFMEEKLKLLKEKRKLLGYKIIKLPAKILIKILFNPKLENEHLLPENENFIIIGNHIKAIDPLIYFYFLKNKPSFLSKKEIHQTKIIDLILKSFGSIPIDRSNKIKSLLLEATKLINYILTDELNWVLIFPEGHRDKNIETFKPGFAYFALNNQVPIIITHIRYENNQSIINIIDVINPIPIEDLSKKERKNKRVELTTSAHDKIMQFNLQKRD